MKDKNVIKSYKHFQENLCNGMDDVSIIVNKKMLKKRKMVYELKHSRQPTIAFCLSSHKKNKKYGHITKHSSMPEINKHFKQDNAQFNSGHEIKTHNKSVFKSNFIVNIVSEHRFDRCLNPCNNPRQTKLKIYRCQLNTHEDTCCCSCNSDAMFEVMKSLYDCYKKKNCDNCDCILCGHLQREERMLGEMRKSLAAVGIDTISAKERKSKIRKAEKAIEGKNAAEKDKILREMAKTRQPLPEGKTQSEKALIDKIRKDLGLPPEPKTAAERARMRKAEAAGIITPLQGKTPAQKEKILRAQAALGIPLPEGRTPSEKSLIHKIKTESGIPVGIPSEKLRKARAAGLITPLEGKTPEQKEKILKGLAMNGIPLPEGKTPSEKKLIDKLRADLGLPPEPKTKSMRDKHLDAAKAGFLEPLEGKSPKDKERILQGLHALGIPLPEGRTPSEKALVSKEKAKPRVAAETLSEKLRKAKGAGLLTPLKGKTPEQREKILRGLAMAGIPLPEGQTPSEKKLIDKVRNDLGLPIEPKTKGVRDKHENAAKLGKLIPLEGKTPAQKEKILQDLFDMGIPLPIGRTPSEKALIEKIKAGPRAASALLTPSERIRKAKAEGLLTPLEGKTPEQKQKILKGLAMHGLPLPESKSPSEKKIIDKIRADLGLPPEPTTPEMKAKYAKAAEAGLLQPLEGKTPAQKEKILQGLHDMGIPLPEGRTPSEKSLIARVKARPRGAPSVIPSLKGKSPEDKEKILMGLAMRGIPLPEGKTPSEKKLIDKVRAELGLPPDPTTPEMRAKHAKAAEAGLLLPLEGKTPKEKERILRGLQEMLIPLPEGRTASEKSLIARIKAKPREPSVASRHSERMRKAKAQGLFKPLAGQSPAERENQLRALAMLGLPLPEGQTPSERKLIDKVRTDLGVPVEPKTKAIRDKHEDASKVGKLLPLEGRTPDQKEKILQDLFDIGIPLPIGRTPSEKALIDRIQGPRAPSGVLAPSERMRRAKAAGLLTPLEGKTPAQKDKILRGLVFHGLPLPEGKTPSEKQLIDKIRADLGLPPEPKTSAMKTKYAKAAEAGLLQPLEGKSPKEKERILRGLADMGIPLPEGRTPSEKSLIKKIKEARPLGIPSEKLRAAKAAGFLTPLEGKTPAQKEKILRGLAQHGIPLPEGKTPSEKKLIDKVRADLGLPPEPHTPSVKEKHAKALAAGLLTPLEGKSPAQKEKILRGLADMGIPLPVGRTPSEKALIAKIKAEPPPSITTDKIRKAKAAGLLTPLAGKTPEQREKILRGLANAGLPLPEGKSPSEKALIDKVKKELGIPDRTPSEKLRKAKAAGLLTPLEGKTPAQREKILRGRAAAGLPLPIGRSPSERALIQKIKDDTGYVTPSPSERLRKAKAAGLITPLKGKTPSMKEKIIKDMIAAGVPIPEGDTPSEKALISRLIAGPPTGKTRSEKMRQAKAAGLLTPLKGKTPEQKEKILRGLIKAGLPLPEPKSASEKDLIDKIRDEVGLPPEPKTPSLKEKYRKAQSAGLITPLEGKTPAEKEKILKRLQDLGIPLPEGRTPSEKSMIKRVKAGLPPLKTPSEKLRAAKAAGLLTPLEGKTPAQKENILRGLAKAGVPLPEGKTPSEKDLINKIRNEMGLPPEPKTPSLKERMQKAHAAGIITPLEGKTPAQKRKILKALADAGIPLPEGRTASEKSLIAKIKAEATPSEKLRRAKATGLLTPLEGKSPAEKEKIMRGLADLGLPLPETKTASEKKMAAKIRKEFGLPPKTPTPSEGKKSRTPSERLRRAKAAGLLTPLEGKTPEEKERIMRGLAEQGLPLPEANTASEKKLAAKIRKELGLPPAPKTPSMKERHDKAAAAGVLVPLEGLSPAEKERVLRAQADLGLPLPEGRTPSEKSLIARIKAEPREPSKISSERFRKAKAAGLLTPLEGKTPAEKERILRGLADAGLPLPEGKTPSEKSLIHKIRTELGLPPPAKTASEKSVIRKAKAAGLFTPITGKSPAEKERILRGLAEAGLPLPVGKTQSEKDLIKKVRAEAGLPPEPTPSEKSGRIKTKAKKVGLTASKRLAKGIEAEEFEDVIKTTTCDRGCGCDKKKIRFKHSYVKIRVTSPDISSLCSCPDECIPGVKAGAFIDNEGIKVTVGQAVGIPVYSRENISLKGNHSKIYTESIKHHRDDSKKSIYKVQSLNTGLSTQKVDYIVANSSNASRSTRPNSTESESLYLQSSTPPYEGKTSKSDRIMKTSRVLRSSGDIYRDPTLKIKSALSSFDSILVLKSETSLSLRTSSSDSPISSVSGGECSTSSNSTHYSGYQSTDDLLSLGSLEEHITSDSDHLFGGLGKKTKNAIDLQRDYTIFRMSQTKLSNGYENAALIKTEKCDDEPVLLYNNLPSKLDITKIMDKILTKKRFTGASSIFIVVPTSDDNDTEDSNSVKSSESTGLFTHPMETDISLRRNSSVKLCTKVCEKTKKFYMKEISPSHENETVQNECIKVLRQIKKKDNKFCQYSSASYIDNTPEPGLIIGTDTTADRPCCCSQKRSSATVVLQTSKSKDEQENVMAKTITPLYLKQGNMSDWFCWSEMNTPSPLPIIIAEPACSFTPRPCCSRLVPSSDACHGRVRQHIIPQTPLPCHCGPDPLEVNLKRSISVGTSLNTNKRSDNNDGQKIKKSVSIKSDKDDRIYSGSDKEDRKALGSDKEDRRTSGFINEDRRTSGFMNEDRTFSEFDKENSMNVYTPCPCAEIYSLPKPEMQPKPRTKSMGVGTELNSSEIPSPPRQNLPVQKASSEHNCECKPVTRPINLPKGSLCACAGQLPEEASKQITEKRTKQVSPKTSKKKIKTVKKKAECGCSTGSLENQKDKSGGSKGICPMSSKSCLCKTSKRVVCKCSSKTVVPANKKEAITCKCKDPKSKQASPKSSDPKATTAPPNPLKIPSPQPQPTPPITATKQAPPGEIPQAIPAPTPVGGSPEQPQPLQIDQTQVIDPNVIDPNVIDPDVPLPPDMAYAYEAYGPSCGWEETGAVMRIRSQLTVSTSGFKMYKPQKNLKAQVQGGQLESNEDEIPLDFEDFIRYYASINPTRFRELMQEGQQQKLELESEDKKAKKAKKKKKGKRLFLPFLKGSDSDSEEEIKITPKKIDMFDEEPCACPYGPIPPPISYEQTKPEAGQELLGPKKGFKFALGGKGSASPGLTGVACFDMSLDSYVSW